MRCASQNLVRLSARARANGKPKLTEGQSIEQVRATFEFWRLNDYTVALRRGNFDAESETSLATGYEGNL